MICLWQIVCVECKIVVILFNYLFNGGNIGIVVFLLVFESFYEIMKWLYFEGYDVDVFVDVEMFKDMIFEGNVDCFGIEVNVYVIVFVDDYVFQEWFLVDIEV